MTEWDKMSDVGRLQVFLTFLLLYVMCLVVYIGLVALTIWGMWNLLGLLFWNKKAYWEALWTIGGPFFLFITIAVEPQNRRYVIMTWKNLKNRRNNFLP